MKAVKIEKPWEISVVEAPMPVPAEGEALIKIMSAGICGSDIGAYRGTNGLVSYPRIIGHELAGVVQTLPASYAGDLKPGDKVVVDPYLFCGRCYPCSIGRTNCCVDLKVLGVHVEGGMSEFFAHPADMLVKVPEDMPWEIIPIAEPLTIALHGLHRLKLAASEHVAIFGAGTIGLLAAMAAVQNGAVPILLDVVDERLAIARELGVPHTLNIVKQNAAEEIGRLTGRRMCECVMEASGANSAIRSTLDLVSHAGRIVLTGWPKESTLIPTDLITRKEIDIRGARVSAGEFEEAVAMIQNGQINVRAILTQVVTIDEAPAVLRDIDKNPGQYLKVNVMMS